MTNDESTPANQTEEKKIDPKKLEIYMEKLKSKQNLSLAIITGLGAAVVGALIWAAISVLTEYQIGYMAIGIGALVGFSIKFTGKGADKIFGILGAALALFGCLLGNLLTVIGFVAKTDSISVFEIISTMDYRVIPDVMIETFDPIDLVFYGAAIYIGYHYSFREITEQELVDNAV